MGILTRKNIFIFNIALLSIVVFLFFTLPTNWCKESEVCYEIYRSDYLGAFVYLSLALNTTMLPFVLISLVTKEKAFIAWKKFAVFALPVVLVLTFLFTLDTGGSNFFNMDFTLYFLGAIYGLFFLISLAIIITSSLKKN